MAFNPRDIALVTSKDDETKKLNKKLWEAMELHDAAAVEEYLEKGAQVNYKKVILLLFSLFCLLFVLRHQRCGWPIHQGHLIALSCCENGWAQRKWA
jgi:hypothetical protein